MADSDDAAGVLGRGLGTGQCLFRDVRDRTGLIQVLPPVLSELRRAFDTTPGLPAPEVTVSPSPAPDPVDEPLPTAPAGVPEIHARSLEERAAAARARARRHRRTPLAAALAPRHEQ
jgi:hypothetical protein